MPAVGAAIGVLLTSTSVGAIVARIAISVAINFAIAKLNQPKGPRPQDLVTEARSSTPTRIRHLGRVRTSGALVFYDWANASVFTEPPSGFWHAIHWLKERRLFKLLAVAEGGMQNVHQWYLDGEPVSTDSEGFVTTAPWNGKKINLRFRKGIEGDEWDGGDWAVLRNAFPENWTSNHRLRGVGTILATFDAVDAEDISEVYPGGDPEVSALIEGAPAFFAIDGSYFVNTRNPMAHLSDVLCNPTYGTLTPADINLSTVTEARFRCNDPVPTQGGTRPRYQSGLSFALSDPLKDTAQRVLDAMGGSAWIGTDGKLNIEVGVWTDPDVTIEERHIVEWEYSGGTERINRVTTLVPTYVAPEVRWQETNADPVEDLAAISLWGEGEPKGVDFLAVQHHGQAAHLATQQLARLNPKRTLTIKLRSFGMLMFGKRKATVNVPRLGLNNAPFWIETLNFDGTNVVVKLAEANPAAIADIAISKEGSAPASPDDVDEGADQDAVTISAVTVITDDGPPYVRVEGTMTTFAGGNLMGQYRRSSGGKWIDMTREDASSGYYSFRTDSLGDLQEYDVRVFFGRRKSDGTIKFNTTSVVVSGIDVVENNTAPGNPQVVSESGSAGNTLTVTFVPDLGANYHRTGLYRAAAGGAFADASLVKWSYDTSSDVTMTSNIPAAGARYWLQSENASQRKSGAVVIGNYPA